MKLAVLCVGNPLRGDDGAGPRLAEMMAGDSGEDLIIYNAETAPENFVSAVKRDSPDVLLIVDAADMNLNPGEVRIIPPGHISLEAMSTHTMPLSMLADYLGEHCGEVIIIGVQPALIDFGTPLSPEVEEALKGLREIILRGEYRGIRLLEK